MPNLPCPQAARGLARDPPSPEPWITAIEVNPPIERPPEPDPGPPLPPAPAPLARWPVHLPRWDAVDCLWWSMLARASYAADETFTRRVAEWAGPVLRLNYRGPTGPDVVGRALIELPDQWLCVIPGTSNDDERDAYLITHALDLVTHEGNPPPGWDLNSTWYVRGSIVWGDAVLWPYPPAKPMTVIGHSAGGGAGAVPLVRVALAGGEHKKALVTFGSMIWGMPLINGLTTSLKAQVIEVTTPGDPIPLMPPPWSLVNLLPRTYRIENRPTYERPGQLLELRGLEGITPRRTADGDTDRVFTAMLSLIRGEVSPVEHKIRHYTRLALDWARGLLQPLGERALIEPLEVIQEDMDAAGI